MKIPVADEHEIPSQFYWRGVIVHLNKKRAIERRAETISFLFLAKSFIFQVRASQFDTSIERNIPEMFSPWMLIVDML